MQHELALKGGAERALFVLASIAKLERSVSMAELIAHTGLAKSTLYRQLVLLKRWGFVIDSHGEYSPGPMCLTLALGFDQSSYLIRESQAELARLSVESGESIGLLVTAHNQIVCLDMVESRQPLRCSFVKGRGLPLTKGASAKALLAFMGQESRCAILRQLHHENMMDSPTEQVLQDELITIRGQGYAVSNGEVDEGVWGVSAPVFHVPQHAAAVITLMAPSLRVSQRHQSLIDMTVRVAASVSSRLQSL